MGDAPLAHAETVGAVKVSETDLVSVGKNDVRQPGPFLIEGIANSSQILSFKVGRG